jgi:hypothetical protein
MEPSESLTEIFREVFFYPSLLLGGGGGGGGGNLL